VKKSTCRAQPIQEYIKKHYDTDMKEDVEIEMARTQPESSVTETKAELKSRWFKAFQRVTREHWENEEDDVKNAIAEEIHKRQEETEAAIEVCDDVVPDERGPSEYAKYALQLYLCPVP
jgi:hypothetical protein